MAQGDHRKTIKVVYGLRAKYAHVYGIFKAIAMTHNNRCLLVRHGDYH